MTPAEAIVKTVSERYARAVSVGERMCCPTHYDFANLKSFIPKPS